MVTLVASVRQQGKSIAEVIRDMMGRRAYILFLLFLWFSLIYIITAFADITATTFSDPVHGPGVASSSLLYLLLAVVMGVTMKRGRISLLATTFVFMPLVFLCIYWGPIVPLRLPVLLGGDVRTTWNMLLLVYCFVAAVIPVWTLLQPRGYLGGFFLALTAGLSFIGVFIGSFQNHFVIQYPAFVSWSNPQGLPLLPLLFTTVACGACSGFHCMISSGTSSKQLSAETDAKAVGYGGMLLECFVAVMALSTLMILNSTQTTVLKDPNQIYANGMAAFLNSLGIPREFALNFALLAFATFVYDTLDVATRLGRYIFQELTGWRGRLSPYAASAVTLILPVIFLTHPILDGNGDIIPSWKVFWTVFGSSNQLLAALVLFGLSLWLFRNKRKFSIALYPSIFMMLVAVVSLFLVIRPWLSDIFLKGQWKADPIGITGLLLIVLAVFLVAEGMRVFVRK
jgi:carbon starvation protein